MPRKHKKNKRSVMQLSELKQGQWFWIIRNGKIVKKCGPLYKVHVLKPEHGGDANGTLSESCQQIVVFGSCDQSGKVLPATTSVIPR